jgi:phenol/toluene 2-monooxygenase (NADH) P2/A2
MPDTTTVRLCGVDLQETESTRALVEAIEADNADITVRHVPGLVKLQSPTAVVIKRESVEARLGRPWETHEFQLAIVSYAGHIAEWDDDRIVIKWHH